MVDAERVLRSFTLRAPLPVGGIDVPPDRFLGLPRHAEHARRIREALPPALLDAFRLLRFNMISALHVVGAFTPDDDGTSPSGFVDDACVPAWWSAANTTSGLAAAQDVHLCSYLCENQGRLFVHLVPSAGDAKSRSSLSGHTDASALPFPAEAVEDGIAPSPDLVILACIRNLGAVETRVAPLSAIHRALDERAIRVLKEPIFDFHPQASFDMAPAHVNRGRPVLVSDANDGLSIRFSHSKVTSVSAEGGAALDALKRAVAGSFVGVSLAPGDVLFVNNRTALHGRSEVGDLSAGVPRWLLRTYGLYSREPRHAADPQSPHLLKPAAGGPVLPAER